MKVAALSSYRELLYAALIVFSAVSLATLEFLKNVYSAEDIALIRKTTVVYMIVLVQVLPALVLLGADRLIAARYGSGRRLRVFRSVLFVVALLLILRQLQLYWGPAEDFTDSVSSLSLALLVLLELTILAAVIGLAIWLFRGLAMFFAYMSPVAIAMTFLIPFQVPTGGSVPGTFDLEVASASKSESQPAVFILVFDGLGYDMLLDEEGKLDAESFPNIAALAQDGVSFTNATTNDQRSIRVLPHIIDPVNSLREDFDIRLYTHYRELEQLYINDCGRVMTCRGVAYLTENDQLRVAGNLVLRSFYQATPERVETAISRPMGWLMDRMGWANPSVDGRGGHLFTKRQFTIFLDDIKSGTALGRIHLLHLLLPHDPFAFNEDGTAQASRTSNRQQAMYVDVLVGKVVSKLKREGLYDEAVVIVTGDHGLRIVVPTPDMPPPTSIPHVPLVIHAPSLNSDVSDVDYQHIDFGPTLTDVLGLPPPNDSEGISAFSEERPQRDKVYCAYGLTFVYNEKDESWQFLEDEP